MKADPNDIRLRPVTYEDLPDLHAWWSDPQVMRPVRAEKFKVSLQEFQEEYWPRWRSPAPDQYHQFIITLDGRAIGEIGYLRESADPCTVSVDIKIGLPRLWGRGLGGRALGLFLEMLFGQLKAERVIAQPGAWNQRSLRLFQGAGFQETGRQEIAPSAIHEGGTMVNLELDRASYLARRGPRRG